MTVDFERGLNTAINKLRAALGDAADSPRFIETVPRKGFRFLDSIEWIAEGVEDPSVHAPREASAQPRSWWPAAAGLVVLLLAAAIATFTRPDPTTLDTTAAPRVVLAILPFEDLSGTPGQAYLSAGLTEEMISRLGGLAPAQLGVLARSSVTAYEQRSRPIHHLGVDFGVDYVLEGSVRRVGERIRITAQLVSVGDEMHLWAETYESGLGDLLSSQRRISNRIAETLALDVLQVPGATSSLDPAVYEAYLKGIHHRDQLTEDGYRRATAEFERALALDPEYAPALASMSACYCLLSGHGLETDEPEILMTRTRELAEQALALDGNLAEAHGTLGMALLKYDWDWEGAERELELATELNPSNPIAAVWYSFYLSSQGRHEEAIAESKRAQASDPISRVTTGNLAWQYYEARRYDEAIQGFDEALTLFPDLWVGHWGGGLARLQKGDESRAIADLEHAVDRSNRSSQALGALAYAYAFVGDTEQSQSLLEELVDRASERYVPPALFVPIHAELGDIDLAFEALEEAFDMRSRSIVWINSSHDFDRLRGDARFDDVVRRMGLAPRDDLEEER
jgi:TolB-like protein